MKEIRRSLRKQSPIYWRQKERKKTREMKILLAFYSFITIHETFLLLILHLFHANFYKTSFLYEMQSSLVFTAISLASSKQVSAGIPRKFSKVKLIPIN